MFRHFSLSIADLYNREITVADLYKSAIYRLHHNSCQITFKNARPKGSVFEMRNGVNKIRRTKII